MHGDNENMVNQWKRDKNIIRGLVVSNFKGQYKHSKLGILWQFITPFILVSLFYIVFKTIRYSGSDTLWLLLCVGIFSYTYMESCIIGGSMCIVSNSMLVKKTYFPSELIVGAHVLTNQITFSIIFSIIVIVSIMSGSTVNYLNLLYIPPIVILMFLFNLGIALLLSSIVVYLRDFGNLLMALSKLLFWTAPTVYTIQETTGILNSLMWCNPMSWFISMLHSIIYYNQAPSNIVLIICIFSAIAAIVIGFNVFHKLKKGFAERL